jgi:hypothetical protein
MTVSRDGVDELVTVVDLAVTTLGEVTDRDWSVPAGTLEWSCWQTADHLVDCVFSYALQFAARADDGWLEVQELHAMPSATPTVLVQALGAVGEMLAAVLRAAPLGAVASDGVAPLGVADWAARAIYEVLVHAHDVLDGLGVRLEPPEETCAWVITCPTLWLFDRDRAATTADPWVAMLLGAGRPAPSPGY